MDTNIYDSLMKAYFAQIESSLKISEIISEHGTEKELSPDSLISGLVYRLIVPMDDSELKESMERADVIYNDIFYNSHSEDSSDEDDNEEEEIDYHINNEPRKIKTNTCNCNICSKVRVCLINFHSHQVNDELAQKFKDSINEACRIHQLTI